jgi:hypothetical protein
MNSNFEDAEITELPSLLMGLAYYLLETRIRLFQPNKILDPARADMGTKERTLGLVYPQNFKILTF